MTFKRFLKYNLIFLFQDEQELNYKFINVSLNVLH